MASGKGRRKPQRRVESSVAASAGAKHDAAPATARDSAPGAPTSRASFELSLPLASTLVAFLCAYLWIARVPMDAFPNSGDEYSYLIQAELFASGRLSAPSLPSEIAEAFMMDHVLDDGTVRSKYPPGWPALLALGELARFPWAVNPLLATLTLWLMFQVTLRLVGVLGAWCALISLGAGPMFIVQAGSFYSQTSSLCALTGYLLILTLALERARDASYLGAGAAAGAAVLIRPFETLIFALGAIPLLPLGARRVSLVVAGASPFALAFLAHNHAAFGSVLSTGYDLYTATFTRLYDPGHPLISLGNAAELQAHAYWFYSLATWATPGIVLLLPLGAWLLWTGAERTRVIGRHLVVTMVIQLVVMHFIYPPGDLAYGPGYIFTAVLPAAVMTGAACEAIAHALGDRARPALVAGGLITLAWSGILAQQKLVEIGNDQRIRKQIYEAVEEAGLKRAVVFMNHMPHFPPSWYVRNGPDFKGEVIYAIHGSRRRDQGVLAHYPGYEGYRYIAPVRGKPPKLTPLPQ